MVELSREKCVRLCPFLRVLFHVCLKKNIGGHIDIVGSTTCTQRFVNGNHTCMIGVPWIGTGPFIRHIARGAF